MGTAMIETSREAFESVDVSELERRVLAAIERFGVAGCISDEVQDMLPLLAYSSVTARFRALLDKGLVVDTGARRPGRSGRRQRVMVARKFWLELVGGSA
jgi:hypothetical protein